MAGSIWRGAISFGLINIPVSVQSAEEDKDLHFNMLDKRNMARIKYDRTNAKTGKEVPWDQIVKGYEYEKNKYVIMTDADFKRANPKATQSIDIQDFVMIDNIDPMYFEKPYYLVPEKTGMKGYYLLQEALIKSKKVAVATVVMHQKQHLVCVFPRGNHLILEMLRFPHTVKDVKSVATLSENARSFKARPQEIKMAERLIEDMTSAWKPEQYKDTYYFDLKKHINQRIKSGQGKQINEEFEDKEQTIKPSKTEELMDLLKASLAGGAKQSAKKSKASKAGKSSPVAAQAQNKSKAAPNKHVH